MSKSKRVNDTSDAFDRAAKRSPRKHGNEKARHTPKGKLYERALQQGPS